MVRVRLSALLLIAVALASSACARAGRTAGPGAPPVSGEPGVVKVGVKDAGHTVRLSVGQRLVVTVPSVPGKPAHLWRYPKRILRPVRALPVTGRFEFVAREPGHGILTLLLPGCAPPTPSMVCAYGGFVGVRGAQFHVSVG